MAKPKKSVFVDTNCFLHLRDLKDLPWRELFPDAEAIDLMVASAVIEELDKHKVGSSRRRRDRSKRAIRLIEEASTLDGFALVLREQDVRLRLVIPARERIAWDEYPKLDRNKADDHIIAEAISFDVDSIILSHDAGPRITARHMNLRAFAPPDTWMLPAEQTDDERKAKQLERQLEAEREKHPKISVMLGRPDADEIVLSRPKLPPLETSLCADLKAEFLSQHPRHRLARPPEGIVSLVLMPGEPTSDDIDRYYENYRNFERMVARYFQTLHEQVFRGSIVQPIDFEIENAGRVSVNSLMVAYSVEGPGRVLASEERGWELTDSLALPKPPRKPKGLDPTNLHNRLISHNFRETKRDPTGFYWMERPAGPADSASLHCEDFRATERRRDCVWVYFTDEPPTQVQVTIRVSGTNLPSPVARTIRVSLQEQEMSWSDSKVRALLPESVRKMMPH